jgi:DtxR family Mn-dependent transcriptional regulator
MESVEREDLLLAVSRLKTRTGNEPAAPDLADFLKRSTADISDMLVILQERGEVIIADDGTVSLSSAGESAACVVMKKHKVLETFFEEMLGMDRAIAHQQACTLEHHASEETISRLDDFIGAKPSTCKLGRFIHDLHSCQTCGCQMLSECQEGDTVRITAVKGCGRAARLADLGLIPGVQVFIRRRLAKTFLVQVKECDIAISADIASSVLIERCR